MIEMILPGVQVAVEAGERQTSAGGAGIVAMALPLSWGDKWNEITAGSDTTKSLGWPLTAPEMKLAAEVVKNASRLLLYRLNTGEQATAEIASGVTAKAVWGGVRGNSIGVTVTGEEAPFTLVTSLDGVEQDRQSISAITDFVPNGLITLEGEGTLAAASTTLTGGLDGEMTESEAISAFLAELPEKEYAVIAYTGTDETARAAVAAFVEQQRAAGVMIQAVVSGGSWNSRAIINSTVGGSTAGYDLTAPEACATMAGILAGLDISGSATHTPVTGWTAVNPRLTLQEQEKRTKAGETLFVWSHGQAMVLYDLNSLHAFSAQAPEDFRKGLVSRTLDRIATELRYLLDTRAVGRIRNTVSGRAQIKGMVVELLRQNYSDRGYIEDFSPDDVTITPMTARDSIQARVGVRAADTVDKVYLTIVSQ